MKENIKERGITLVSLVVTVVVLMLLAGIIITTSLENNGVLNIANSKKEETEKMTIEENIKIELQEDPPESYSELIKLLKNYGEIQNEEIPDEAILITKNDNYKIYVKDIWNIDKKELGISIGQYVEYSYDGGNYIVEGIYSGTNQNQTINIPGSSNTIWRVIDVNKQSNQIKIVPTNLNNYSVTLKGANGFNNGVKILNDICNNIFGNSQYATNARNINVEDIEKLCSNVSELRGTVYGTEKKYSSIVCPNVVNKENDISIQNEFFYNFETVSNFNLMQTYYSGNMLYTSSSYEKLIPSGSYWVTSRAINNGESAEYYLRTINVESSINLSGFKLFDSNGEERSNSFNILPVVTLNNIEFYDGIGTKEDPYKLQN